MSRYCKEATECKCKQETEGVYQIKHGWACTCDCSDDSSVRSYFCGDCDGDSVEYDFDKILTTDQLVDIIDKTKTEENK